MRYLHKSDQFAVRAALFVVVFVALAIGTNVSGNWLDVGGAVLLAQEEATADMPAAPIINDEGGPVAITGSVQYNNVFFTRGVAAPLVILEDQAGFIDRDEHFLLPVESQTLGQITSDFYTSPFSYTIALPLEPQGTLRDVDQDGEDDQGVMVFAAAYWTNTFGDPYLEERDLYGGGWSTAYASTRVSRDLDTKREIIGGKFIVYAQDDQQGFPSGFGADGLLFTADDPIVQLPQGYTVVDMDTDPFTFDRSRYPVIDLIEPDGAATEDFSDLSYSAAFDAMIEKLRKEYAFTDYKNVDWAQLAAEFRPRFVAAEEEGDPLAYRRALRDLILSIPDGHFSSPFLEDEFRQAVVGGIGLAIRQLDDGRVLVNYITENGPADRAGIELGAEILAIDGQSIDDALDAVVPWSAPFSTEHVGRLQQLRYLVRSPLGAERTITLRNPAEAEPITVTLTAVSEQDSFRFSALRGDETGFELPLEYELLDSGYAYVKIYRFSDNKLLTIQLWERLMRALNEQETPALIIDMRQNSGGNGFLADQMAAYFYEESHELGNAGYYNEELDDFYFDPRGMNRYYLPADDLRYHGEVIVLIGPNCNSACEFFTYDLTIDERAAIVGHYPTAGLGGSIDLFIMPENERIQFTAGRAVDMNGAIHIEGKGVAPTVRVPINEETLFSAGDPVLAAAIAHLEGADSATVQMDEDIDTASPPVDAQDDAPQDSAPQDSAVQEDESEVTVVDGGAVRIGDTISGQIAPNSRTRYTISVRGDDVVSFYLENEDGELDTVLRLYDEAGALLVENDDAATDDTVSSAIEELTSPTAATFIVEVATFADALSGEYTLRITGTGAADEPGAAPDTVANADARADGGQDEAAQSESGDASAAADAVDTDTEPTTDTLRIADIVTGLEARTEITSTENTDAANPQPEDDAADETSPPVITIGTATVTTEGGRLRVRAEPDIDADVVGFVAEESSHGILGFSEDGRWVRIAVADLDVGDEGWVAMEFVDIALGR